MSKIKASIIGVTGYTGVELLRLLLAHPHVEIAHLTSRQHDNTPIGDVFAHLSHLDLKISNTNHNDVTKDSDIVFLALPHKTAQDVVADLHGKVKMIDLSADYRLDDAAVYEKYYTRHNHPDLLQEIIYGAPEIVGRDAIANSSTIANPGCFALLAQLMLFPFKGHIKHADIIMVTGSSGSGKSVNNSTHHPIRSHNMKSYNVNSHRHIAEITRGAGITEDQLNFVPTSGPFVRGIFAQGFVTLKDNQNILHNANSVGGDNAESDTGSAEDNSGSVKDDTGSVKDSTSSAGGNNAGSGNKNSIKHGIEGTTKYSAKYSAGSDAVGSDAAGNAHSSSQHTNTLLRHVKNTYAPAPFIRIMENNSLVALANIVGSNYADLSFEAGNNGSILVQGALDNLVKGASGVAVQNMNLMFGFDEKAGLDILAPVYP